MDVDWDSAEILKWKQEARLEQQDYFELIGSRKITKFKPSDYSNLKRNIGFAVFGPPENEPNEHLNDNTGYDQKQLKHINKTFDYIKQCMKSHYDKENIWLSFIFVCGKIGDNRVRIPIIRVPKYDMTTSTRNSDIFIDSCPRVYDGWQDYLKNNKLPDCLMCYPMNGIYSATNGVVELEFGISPAATLGAKVVQGCDIAGTVLGVAAAGVGITALFMPVVLPVAIADISTILLQPSELVCVEAIPSASMAFAHTSSEEDHSKIVETSAENYNTRHFPETNDLYMDTEPWKPTTAYNLTGAALATVTTGAYTTGRSIHMLVDRDKHMQSIGLNNTESRNCWLGIGGSILGMASGGTVAAATKVAMAGETLPLVGQIAMKTVTAGSSVANALGVVNGLANLVVKVKDEETVTPLDVFQFASSILFFTNSVISAHQANALINSIGRNSSTGSIVEGNMLGTLKNISNFVKRNTDAITGVSELCNFESVTGFVIGGSSMITSPVMRANFFSIFRWVHSKLIEVTKYLMQGIMTLPQYIVKANKLMHRLWESWNEEMTEVVGKICQSFGVKHWSDVAIDGTRILTGTKPCTLREIASTVIAAKRAFDIELSKTETAETSRRQDISGGSVGCSKSFNDDVNTYDDKETQTTLDYEKDIADINAKFANLQMCSNPADFLKYLKFVCKFVKDEFETEKQNYMKILQIVQSCSPEVNVEEFNKQYGICGNPCNYFFQKVMNQFRVEGKEGFFRLKLAYDTHNACSQPQGEVDQTFFFTDGVEFHTFKNKKGLAPNGMFSREQFYELTTELMRQCINECDFSIAEEGNTAIIQVKAGEAIIVVNSYFENGEVTGIATILHNTGN